MIAVALFQFPKKDPNSTKDYQFYWVNWLAGDTISSATFSIVNVVSGVTISASGFTPGTATCWLAGGNEGKMALLRCRITTAAGRVDERTAQVPIGSA